MACDGIYISGYFLEEEKEYIQEISEELHSREIPLYVRNLSGQLIQAAFDFADFELIQIGYTVLKSFLLSGGYDIVKLCFMRLWMLISKGHGSNRPFTISIEGIPTVNGPETIKCKIKGCPTDKMKNDILDKTFSLAAQIENHQFQLLERSPYYTALEGHLFTYDTDIGELVEMDIAKEVQKLTHKAEENPEN